MQCQERTNKELTSQGLECKYQIIKQTIKQFILNLQKYIKILQIQTIYFFLYCQIWHQQRKITINKKKYIYFFCNSILLQFKFHKEITSSDPINIKPFIVIAVIDLHGSHGVKIETVHRSTAGWDDHEQFNQFL